MTALRQQYIDDLKLRNFSAGTIKVYVHAVEKFARFLKRSPDDATVEDVSTVNGGLRKPPRGYWLSGGD